MKKIIRVVMEGFIEVETDYYPDDISNDPVKMIEFDLDNDPGYVVDAMDMDILSAAFSKKSKKQYQAELEANAQAELDEILQNKSPDNL